MARHGVTYVEVSEAASQLLGQGRNPTIEQVRLLLGTGSSTTIAAHLKAWRESQSTSSLLSAKENVPEELISMVKGLWERVIAVSDEKLEGITTHYQTSLNELQENLEKYRHNNQRWQHLYHQWNKEKDCLYDERNQREKGWQQLKEEYSTLKSLYDQSIQQLLDKQDHIQELQRLHQQSQQNHEHFRLTTQEQRQVEQAQFTEHKNALQAEIKKLNIQLSEQKNESDTLRNAHHLLEQNLVTIGSEKTVIELTLQSREKELQQLEKEIRGYIQTSQYLESHHRKLQQDLDKQTLKQQTDMTILSQQLASTQQSLETTELKNTQLQQEYRVLIQEKSMLEGRIKQWEISGSFVPV